MFEIERKKERRGIFLFISLLIHLMIGMLLFSMPVKTKSRNDTDYSRHIIIDFDIPAPSSLKTLSYGNNQKGLSKKLIATKKVPLNNSKGKKISKSSSSISEKEKGKNKRREDLPLKFTLNGKNKDELIGIQNISFSKGSLIKGNSFYGTAADGREGSGFGKSSSSGNGNGKGISSNGNSANPYYSTYYDICLKQIEKNKRYPQKAIIRQIEGDVDVNIVLNENGKLIRANILKSSGWDMLDEEAIECVKRASPFPKPPKELLLNSRLSLTFTIIFEIL